jgi:hypothetical protein
LDRGGVAGLAFGGLAAFLVTREYDRMMVDCLETGVVTKKSPVISKIKQKATLRKGFK